jgi:hypothetical protein
MKILVVLTIIFLLHGLRQAVAGPAIFECRVEQVLVSGANGELENWRNPYVEVFKSSPLSINRLTGVIRYFGFGPKGRRGEVVANNNEAGMFIIDVDASAGKSATRIEINNMAEGSRKPLQMRVDGKLLIGHCV